MDIGIWRMDITPPISVHLQGYLRGQPCDGILDPLFATALAIRDGEQVGVLVSLDLIGLPWTSVNRIRQSLQRQANLPPEAVMLLCSHTHYAPAVVPLMPLSDPPDENYVAMMERWVVTAALQALRHLRPCDRVRWGEGMGSLGINRRLPTQSGITFAPNPNGIVDRRLRVVAFDQTALLTHYICHPTTMAGQVRKVSADYVGAMRDTTERLLAATVLFAQGCCGQIRPQFTDETGMRFRGATPEEMRKVGTELGLTAVKAWAQATAIKVQPLRFARRVIALPLSDLPTRRELRQATQSNDRVTQLWARWWLRQLRQGVVTPQSVRVEVQVWRLGDLCIIALSGEPMLELGWAIENTFKPELVIVCGYANAIDVGYLCPRDAVREGGYEPAISYKAYSLPAPLKEGAAERLVDVAVELTKSVRAL